MELKCGYNCINLTLGRTFNYLRLDTIKSGDIGKVQRVYNHNIKLLGDLLEWNLLQGVKAFRVSSGLFPFLNHATMQSLLRYYPILTNRAFVNEICRIKNLIIANDISLSVHPGQYNVLNSHNSATVERTINELEYQNKIMNLLGGKIIVLHLGGGFKDKRSSIARFIEVAHNNLSASTMSKLSLENDDKIFNVDDVTYVAERLGCNWVYDFHHEKLNNSKDALASIKDFNPIKYHICQGRGGELVIPHAYYVDVELVNKLINQLEGIGIDKALFMFEAKGKELTLFDAMESQGNGLWTTRKVNKRFET